MLAILQPVVAVARFSKATAPRDRIAESLWRRFGGKLGQAILRAIAATVDDMVLADVEWSLEHGDLAGAIAAIPWEKVGEASLRDAAEPLIRDALEGAGQAAAKELSREVSTAGDVGLSFAVTREEIAGWVTSEVDQVVRYVSEAQMDGINRVIQAVMNEELNPARAARLLREGDLIGLAPRDVNAVFNFLRRQREAGVSLTEADKRAIAYTNRLLDRRAETIARTEMQRALTRGELEMWRQARSDGHFGTEAVKEWVVDGDPCPECQDLDGEMVAIDDTFSSGDDGPPLHPNCECSLELHQDGPGA